MPLGTRPSLVFLAHVSDVGPLDFEHVSTDEVILRVGDPVTDDQALSAITTVAVGTIR